MALIQCPECKKQISNQAQTCPNCGIPLKPVTIEQTSKSWKLLKLFSWLTLLFAIYAFIDNHQNGGFQNPWTGFWFSVAFLGFLALMISNFGTWWSNK